MSYLKSHGSPTNGRADCHKVHSILCAADTKQALGSDRWFSATSKVDLFEIRGSEGVMRHNLNDQDVSTELKKNSTNESNQGKDPVHTRVFFIDEVKGDVDRLRVTSKLFQDILTTYNISPRVACLLERQGMPGRVVQYDPVNGKPTHHQYWYSTIIRSNKSVFCLDSSKSVLSWMRFCVWVGRDITAGVTSILVLRCPGKMKPEFLSAFADNGDIVKHTPMLLDAFFAQGALLAADKFSESWADPIYEWETKVDEDGSAADFTARSRTFLTLNRQITQVATDYEILLPTLKHLKSEHEWICSQSSTESSGSASPFSTAAIGVGDMWDVYLAECHLLKTYADLYKTRTKIGINECFAMVSQRDSEVNIQMAKESTQIARTSHQDGKSLRTIQILTMIFLPASLFSGIFGMGFFNTSPDDQGNVNFSVSSNWWWYLALTIPMTTIILASMGGWQSYEKWQMKSRKVDDSDASKQV